MAFQSPTRCHPSHLSQGGQCLDPNCSRFWATAPYRNSATFTPHHYEVPNSAPPQSDMESTNLGRRYLDYSFIQHLYPSDYAWGMPHVQQYPPPFYGYGRDFAYPPQMTYPPVYHQGLEAVQLPAPDFSNSAVIATPEDTPSDSGESAHDGKKSNNGSEQMTERADSLVSDEATHDPWPRSVSTHDGDESVCLPAAFSGNSDGMPSPCWSDRSGFWGCGSTVSDPLVTRGALPSRSEVNEDCGGRSVSSRQSLPGPFEATLAFNTGKSEDWNRKSPSGIPIAGRHMQPSCTTDDGRDAWGNQTVSCVASPREARSGWHTRDNESIIGYRQSKDAVEQYNGLFFDSAEDAIQNALKESLWIDNGCHIGEFGAFADLPAYDNKDAAMRDIFEEGFIVEDNVANLKPGANELHFLRRCIMKANVSPDDRYKALGILSTLSSSGKILHTPNITPAAPATPKDTTGETLGRIEALLQDLHINKTTSTTPPEQTPSPTTIDTKARTDLVELRTQVEDLSKALKVAFSEEHTRDTTLTTEVSILKDLLWSLDCKFETFTNRINHEILELKRPYQAPSIDYGRCETHIQQLEDKVDQLDSTATGTKKAFGTLYQDLRNKMTSLEIGYHALRK